MLRCLSPRNNPEPLASIQFWPRAASRRGMAGRADGPAVEAAPPARPAPRAPVGARLCRWGRFRGGTGGARPERLARRALRPLPGAALRAPAAPAPVPAHIQFVAWLGAALGARVRTNGSAAWPGPVPRIRRWRAGDSPLRDANRPVPAGLRPVASRLRHMAAPAGSRVREAGRNRGPPARIAADPEFSVARRGRGSKLKLRSAIRRETGT